MKDFLIKFFFFMLPFLVVSAVIEYRFQRLPNSYNVKRKYLEQQLDSIEVINLGASNALFGINPDYLSRKTFNLADVSQSIYYDKRLMIKYVDKMPKLKLVIIPLGTFSLYYQLHDEVEEWRDYYYYHFWHITYKYLPLYDVRRYSYIALYSMEFTKNYVLDGFKTKNTTTDILRSGYELNDSSGHVREINDVRGKKRADFHNYIFNEVITRKNGAAEIRDINSDLCELVAYLQKKDINVVLLTPPVFHTYLDHLDTGMLTLLDTTTRSICRQYGINYYNYLTDTRFNIDDYANNDHLSTYGAVKFSKIIDSEVIKPVFQKL